MTAASSHMWYVKAASGVWGPYPEARVSAFVAEGRVRADTPVSPWAQGPFAPAAANPEFSDLFEARAVPSAREVKADRRAAGGGAAAAMLQITAPAPAPVQPAALRPLLVWAELSAQSTPGFHSALAATGAGVTIRRGLWLVQASMGAAALRNHLSRTLTGSDALLVVEVALEQAAWFNLDPARDRELRRLWSA